MLTVFRALAFGFSGGLSPITNSFVAESAPPRLRGVMVGLLQCGYPIGWFVASMVVVPLMTHYGWRSIFLVGFVIVPLSALVYRLVPESPRFEVVKQVAANRESWRDHLGELFGRQRRWRTLLSGFAFFAQGGAYAGSAFYLPTFFHEVRGYDPAQAARIVGLSYGIGLIGYIGASLAGEFLWTRRNTIIVWCWAGALAFLGFIWLRERRSRGYRLVRPYGDLLLRRGRGHGHVICWSSTLPPARDRRGARIRVSQPGLRHIPHPGGACCRRDRMAMGLFRGGRSNAVPVRRSPCSVSPTSSQARRWRGRLMTSAPVQRIAVLGSGYRPTGSNQAPPEIARIAAFGFRPELVETRFGAFPKTPYDRGLAAIGYLDAGIKAEQAGYRALFLNTFGDYGIAELRSALGIPVVGAGETAMTVAATLGRRFAIVTVWPRSMNFIYDERLATTGMTTRCVAIRNILDDGDLNKVVRGDPDDPVSVMRQGSNLSAVGRDSRPHRPGGGGGDRLGRRRNHRAGLHLHGPDRGYGRLARCRPGHRGDDLRLQDGRDAGLAGFNAECAGFPQTSRRPPSGHRPADLRLGHDPARGGLRSLRLRRR